MNQEQNIPQEQDVIRALTLANDELTAKLSEEITKKSMIAVQLIEAKEMIEVLQQQKDETQSDNEKGE